MAIHVVMEPPVKAGQNASENAVFVRDGFYFFGFIAPILWLLWHRLWLAAIVTLAATLALAAVIEAAGLASLPATLLPLLISLYVGLEGGALRLAKLRRAGWRQWGVIEADSTADAETRYLFADGQVEDRPVSAVAVSSAAPRREPSGAALGLLQYPGRN
ncbi:DUF2628 domain-containing protein [Mesorhizobium sp. ANAO-SY3R2]|uniref:DUF2628 domain-containing protein n=1 Tax=Mesorhizobium sp. ANAO-SY3R2 TaxID=3166644 RepID=UPI003671E5D3